MRLPIVQAPMAGGATAPALVAAVSAAGGLGCIAAAYTRPSTSPTPRVRSARAPTPRSA